MATVVDALTVTLGLDAAGFKKGQQETQEALKQTEGAATRTAKTMQAEGGRASEFFTAAKVEALALLGVLTGGAGLIAGFKDTAAGLNAVNRAAIASGESTQFIQAFSAAIGRTGGNVETAKQQLIQFAATVEQFKLRGGNSPLAQYSQILGIDPLNAKPQEVIEGIMRAIERNPGPSGRQYILNMGAQIGVPNDLMLSLLQIGTLANLQAAIQRSIELGAVQSQKQIDAAIKFQDAVVAFEQAIKGLTTALIPFEFLAKQINNTTEVITHPRDNPRTIRKWLKDHLGIDLGNTEQRTSGAVPSGTYGPRIGDTGTLTASQRALAGAISGAEAGGYNVRYGGGTFDTNGPHPGVINGHSPAGLYQITEQTWLGAIAALGLSNVMSPANQDAVFAYLLRKHGVTDEMIADPSRRSEVKARLLSEWPSIPGGSQPNPATAGFDRRLGGGLAGPRRSFSPEDMPSRAPLVPAPSGPPSFLPDWYRGLWRGSTNNSTETHVGAVNIYPPSGDPKTMAHEIGRELAREIAHSTNAGMA